jgi:hypothetical protein
LVSTISRGTDQTTPHFSTLGAVVLDSHPVFVLETKRPNLTWNFPIIASVTVIQGVASGKKCRVEIRIIFFIFPQLIPKLRKVV